MVDPQPTLVQRLVRHGLLPRERLPQIRINSDVLTRMKTEVARAKEPTHGELPRRIGRQVAGGFIGSVSKVEMVTAIALIYKELFLSISTFETPPKKQSTT
jgi:hypothetical protein